MSFPAGGGTNLPTSGQLQEAAAALATTAGKYAAVSEDLLTVAATSLAAGQDLTTQWRGQAPASFLTSLDKLAGDVSNIADALATSANAMMTLADAIGSNTGTIGTATQLTAQEPAHPSSGQAQQLSNALVAANAAMGAITAAANSAAGQLDQVKGVGTCSTGKGRIAVSVAAGLVAGVLIGKALNKGKGGGKGPPGPPPPAPPAGEEPPDEGWWKNKLRTFSADLKKNWKLALADAFISAFFGQWFSADKNYTISRDEPLWKVFTVPNIYEPFIHLPANYSWSAIEKNGLPGLISVGSGGVGGIFLGKLGGVVGTVVGSTSGLFLNPPAAPPITAIIMPDGMVHVEYWDNGKLIQSNMSPLAADELGKRLNRQVLPVSPPPPKPEPKSTPTPSAPTHVVPHPPPG